MTPLKTSAAARWCIRHGRAGSFRLIATRLHHPSAAEELASGVRTLAHRGSGDARRLAEGQTVAPKTAGNGNTQRIVRDDESITVTHTMVTA